MNNQLVFILSLLDVRPSTNYKHNKDILPAFGEMRYAKRSGEWVD